MSESAQGRVVMPLELGVRDWLGQLRHRRGGVVAATFDTKVVTSRLPGSAAKASARALHRHGYRMVADPAHFFVANAVGPLVPGEPERAFTWAEELAGLMPPRAASLPSRFGHGHGHVTHRRTA